MCVFSSFGKGSPSMFRLNQGRGHSTRPDQKKSIVISVMVSKCLLRCRDHVDDEYPYSCTLEVLPFSR